MPPVSLDNGPPLPPQLAGQGGGAAPPQQGSMQQMAGGSSPSSSLQTNVIERLMLAEKVLRDTAGIMPALSPVIDDVTARLRAGAGQVLMSSLQGGGSMQPPGMGGGSSLLNSGTQGLSMAA